MSGKEHPGCSPMDTQHDERQKEMSDIVEWLRPPASVFYEYAADNGALLEQAADEIEKLRAAIKMALECIEDVDVIGAKQTLAKALGEKE